MFSIIKAGMASARNELSVISNNVANSNTTGFKKSISSYADLAPSSMSDSIQATSSGLGAIVDDTRLNHSQSTLLSTEKKTDLGLAGNGFFIIKKNLNDAPNFTRSGSFSLDPNGFLTTSDNCFVMSKPLIDGQFSDANVDIDGLLPLQIPLQQDEKTMSNLTIEEDGKISAQYGDDTPPVAIGTLALGLFTNPEALRELGNSRYAATQKSGDVQIGSPASSGFAAVKSGALEVSNVDVTDELTSMIRAQQQFNGAARLLQTNSELLEKLTR